MGVTRGIPYPFMHHGSNDQPFPRSQNKEMKLRNSIKAQQSDNQCHNKQTTGYRWSQNRQQTARTFVTFQFPATAKVLNTVGYPFKLQLSDSYI